MEAKTTIANHCKTCGKQIKETFTNGGYNEYCYECGYIAACKDYDNQTRELFYAELEREDPDFTDFYEDADQFI
jgi:uncharacterized Zn finger protein